MRSSPQQINYFYKESQCVISQSSFNIGCRASGNGYSLYVKRYAVWPWRSASTLWSWITWLVFVYRSAPASRVCVLFYGTHSVYVVSHNIASITELRGRDDLWRPRVYYILTDRYWSLVDRTATRGINRMEGSRRTTNRPGEKLKRERRAFMRLFYRRLLARAR